MSEETTQSVAAAADEGVPRSPAARSLWEDAWRRLMRDRGAVVSVIVILLYVMVALGGTVYDLLADNWGFFPTFAEMKDYQHTNEAPSLRSWQSVLGTDWAGKSVLIKTFLGAKVSLTVGFMANVIAVPLGMLLGAIAGYCGRWIDDVITWLYSTLSSIPGIILLIAMKYAFKGVTVSLIATFILQPPVSDRV